MKPIEERVREAAADIDKAAAKEREAATAEKAANAAVQKAQAGVKKATTATVKAAGHHVAAYWRLDKVLKELQKTIGTYKTFRKKAIALVRNKDKFHRAINIGKHFETAKQAEECGKSLRAVLDDIKASKPRKPTTRRPDPAKAAKVAKRGKGQHGKAADDHHETLPPEEAKASKRKPTSAFKPGDIKIGGIYLLDDGQAIKPHTVSKNGHVRFTFPGDHGSGSCLYSCITQEATEEEFNRQAQQHQREQVKNAAADFLWHFGTSEEQDEDAVSTDAVKKGMAYIIDTFWDFEAAYKWLTEECAKRQTASQVITGSPNGSGKTGSNGADGGALVAVEGRDSRLQQLLLHE